MKDQTRAIILKLLVFLASITAFFNAQAQTKRILIVSTNRDSVGTHVSGTFLKEIAYPFQYFLDKGFEVDIVTPAGGKAAIYHAGSLPGALEKIQQSEAFQTKIASTLSSAEASNRSYAGIFYPGGHGQYFDVVNDERLAELTSCIYESGGVVGTAGHGVASLINVRLSNGNFLVNGKRITCFPHWAELAYMNISNYGKLLAFDMEEVLRRRGAELVVCTKETRSDASLTLVADKANRLVTGAFASSAQWVAEQMVDIVNNGASPTVSEQSLILAAVNKYIEGRNSGNLSLLKQAFLPTASLTGVDAKTNEPAISPITEYVQRNKEGQQHDCTTTVRILDYSGNIAVAQVTFEYSTHRYYDYLTLLKITSGWIIADKTYTKSSR